MVQRVHEEEVDIEVHSDESMEFTEEQECLFQKRLDEHYDIFTDPEYLLWLKINHSDCLLLIKV